MTDLISQLGNLGIVPVVKIDMAKDAVPLARALLDGGLPCAEITFRTDAAAESIRLISAEFPQMLIGAGTILTVTQAKDAIAAGATFIVTPGFDADIVDYCLSVDMPILPGVITPTEINLALNKGLDVLKFFPAEAAGGVTMLKALGGPYGAVRFMPTGGINPNNLGNYLNLSSVVACGGSWMVKAALIAEGDFAQITQLAADAVALAQQGRHPKSN